MPVKRHLIHDEKLNSRKLKLISFLSLMMGFSQAAFIYVMSYYFKLASGIENLGIFFLISYSIVLIILLNFHKIIKLLGKSRVFFFSYFIKLIAIAFLAIVSPSWAGVAILMVYIIFGNLSWVALDVILESFSVDKMSGRIRGLYLTILNAGFIFGPFVSTRILDKYDFQGIFIFLLIFNSIIFIISLLGLRDVNHRFKRTESVTELLKKIYKRKNILRSYYMSFTLYFFYALMIIYIPLYLLDLGMSIKDLGFVFTVMLVPFILLQYPIGIIADKKLGEKELIILALIIICFSTFAIYFIESTSIFVWAAILFITRIGAAMMEILSDSYFYKRIDGDDVDVIDFFRTARSAAYISVSAITAIVLIFFPLKSVFLLVPLVAFSALFPAFRLVDNKSEKELLKN